MELSGAASLAKRAALYGLGGVFVGALGYGGWMYHPEADAATLLACGQFDLSIGQYAHASSCAVAVLRSEPHDLHALLMDAHCLAQLKRKSESADRYRQALEVTNDADMRSEIRTALALNALDSGDADAAQAQVSVDEHPKNAETRQKYLYVRGLASRTSGLDAEAVDCFMKMIDPKAETAALVVDASVQLIELGKAAVVEPSLQRLAATDTVARYELAKLKWRQGNAETCVEHLRLLGSVLKKQLAGRVRADAETWLQLCASGSVPADVKALVTPNLSWDGGTNLKATNTEGLQKPSAVKGEPVR